MAQNDFKITDIVDQSAFDQLDRLQKRFEDLKVQFVAVTSSIGKGISMPVGNIDDMTGKMEAFRRQQQELIKTQEQLADVENKYYDLLSQVNDLVATKISNAQKQTTATTQLEKAQEKLLMAESEEGKELAILKERTRQLNAENKANARLALEMERNNGSLAKSYNELSAQYSKLKIEINRMSKAERESDAGKQKIGEAKAIYEQMKLYQEQTGKFQLNVGNYKNAILEALGVNSELASKIMDVAKGMNAQAIQMKASAAATQLDTMAKSKNIVVSKAAIAAQRVLNLVVKANPYVLLATAVAAVTTALLAYARGSIEAARQQRILEREVEKTTQALSRMEEESDFGIRIAEAAGASAQELRKMRYEAAAAANEMAYLALQEGKKKYYSGDMKKEDYDKLVQNEQDTWDRLMKVMRDNVVASVEDHHKITKQAADTQKDIAQEAAKEVSDIASRYAFMAASYNDAMNKEMEAEVARYESGEITKEEFERKKLEIEKRYAMESANLAVTLAEEQLQVENLSTEQRIQLAQKLAEARNALAKMVTDERISAQNDVTENARKQAEEEKQLDEEVAERQREIEEERLQQEREYQQQRMELIQQTVQTMTMLFSSMSQIITSNYDKDLDELDKKTQEETDRYTRMAESGAISTEEAEARKRAAEQKSEEQREAIQKKQADAQKASNIASTIMNTAVAIMKAWSQGGIFAAPMVALIAAQGAIQLATIMATKAYAKGTDNAAGGLSIVGDGGRPEIVLSRGKAWITPDTPTLVNLHKGDKVLPDAQSVLTGKLMSDYALLSEQLKEKREDGMTVNVTNDHGDLRKEMEVSNDQLEDIRMLLRRQARNAEWMRIYSYV